MVFIAVKKVQFVLKINKDFSLKMWALMMDFSTFFKLNTSVYIDICRKGKKQTVNVCRCDLKLKTK